MRNAKTIQIFLPDGNPRGVRIADFKRLDTKVYLIPQSSLNLALKRDELSVPALYILFGENKVDGKQTAYIGEAENFAKRIRDADHQKREWMYAIVAISKHQEITKTEVKYLESISIDAARKANRYRLENNKTSNKPHVRESDEAEILNYFETMQLLVSTLGYPIFDEAAKGKKEDLLYCRGKGAQAIGEYTDDGLVVFAGSTCALKVPETAGAWINQKRKELMVQGILKLEGDLYRFTENYVFSAPSAAANVVLARHANGWKEWKYENGKTLDEVKRQN